MNHEKSKQLNTINWTIAIATVSIQIFFGIYFNKLIEALYVIANNLK